jgi:hypothetical protein
MDRMTDLRLMLSSLVCGGLCNARRVFVQPPSQEIGLVVDRIKFRCVFHFGLGTLLLTLSCCFGTSFFLLNDACFRKGKGKAKGVVVEVYWMLSKKGDMEAMQAIGRTMVKGERMSSKTAQNMEIMQLAALLKANRRRLDKQYVGRMEGAYCAPHFKVSAFFPISTKPAKKSRGMCVCGKKALMSCARCVGKQRYCSRGQCHAPNTV